MKVIPVKMVNKSASVPCYVDDWDYETLKHKRWYIGGDGYARSASCGKVRGAVIYMQRIVIWCPDGYVVDHINRDTLDNRKENLRICSRAENQLNRGAQVNNTSGFKGVSWSDAANKWVAKIGHEGKTKHLGVFSTREDAANAYNTAALRYHGKFAYKNIVNLE